MTGGRELGKKKEVGVLTALPYLTGKKNLIINSVQCVRVCFRIIECALDFTIAKCKENICIKL